MKVEVRGLRQGGPRRCPAGIGRPAEYACRDRAVDLQRPRVPADLPGSIRDKQLTEQVRRVHEENMEVYEARTVWHEMTGRPRDGSLHGAAETERPADLLWVADLTNVHTMPGGGRRVRSRRLLADDRGLVDWHNQRLFHGEPGHVPPAKQETAHRAAHHVRARPRGKHGTTSGRGDGRTNQARA